MVLSAFYSIELANVLFKTPLFRKTINSEDSSDKIKNGGNPSYNSTKVHFFKSKFMGCGEYLIII